MHTHQEHSFLKKTSSALADLHVHTSYCGHGKGTVKENVLAAIRSGLGEIGFTGHFPYPKDFVEPIPDCVIPEDEFPNFRSDVLKLKHEFENQITIRLAVEVDYLPGLVDQTREMVEEYTFDYVLGSVHFIENVAVDYSKEMLIQNMEQLGGVEGMWEMYWRYVEELVRSDLCDVVSHLDLPRKFGISRPMSDFRDRIDHLINLMKDRGLVLEINTGGIDRSFDREPYPSLQIIQQIARKEIDIMLGSDAHRPEEVGRYFHETAELLRSLGWRKYVVFEDRKKIYRSL